MAKLPNWVSWGKADLPEPVFVVGELVHIKGYAGLYRVQQVLYRSWEDIKTRRYNSGYGYKMPIQGDSGFYWMETQLDKPAASVVVSWKDCIWQPKRGDHDNDD